MSIFSRLKNIKRSKKENDESKIDYEVSDLKIGYILDYDMASWEVTDIAEYEWDNGVKDFEYTIFNGKKSLYLNRTSSGDLSIYWDAKFEQVWAEAKTLMISGNDLSTHSFVYDGSGFQFSGEGYARVRNSKEVYDMQNWLFESNDESFLASFNKYEDKSTEVYLGKHLEPFSITNILPRV